jgi:hypothetical protein
MKKILSTAAAAGVAAALTTTGAGVGTAQAEFIKIGTGGQTGV